jgi:hypothetical protein
MTWLRTLSPNHPRHPKTPARTKPQTRSRHPRGSRRLLGHGFGANLTQVGATNGRKSPVPARGGVCLEPFDFVLLRVVRCCGL